MKSISKGILKDFNFLRHKVKRREKVSIAAILIGAFLIGVLASVVAKKLQFPYRRGPQTASLKLETDKKSVRANTSFEVEIELNSGEQGVEAADFVVTYDPAYLSVVKVDEGNFFKTYPIKKVEPNFVKISGVASLVKNTLVVPKGKGEIGSITFTALKNVDSTSISFNRQQTIVASSGQNILDQNKIKDLNITIK